MKYNIVMKTKLDEFVDWFIQEYKNKTIEIIDNNPEEISEMLYDSLKETVLSKMKPNEINTIEDLAKLLNGNNYGDELENPYGINVEELCKKNKWVVLFPYSDDNLEARGYIDDELVAFNGSWYKIYKEGEYYPDEDEENTYHKATKNMIIITSYESDCDIKLEWCNEEYDEETKKTYIWNFIVLNEQLPHTYFDIVDEDDEEDQIWAKCCVIDCSDI